MRAAWASMQAVMSSLTTSTASSATGQPLGSSIETREAEAKSRAAETAGVVAGKARWRVKHMAGSRAVVKCLAAGSRPGPALGRRLHPYISGYSGLRLLAPTTGGGRAGTT